MRYELQLPRRHRADGVMTVSDTLADRFVETGYPRDRVRPIYYGYDAACFRPLPAGSASPAEPPVVVMHGSFDQHHLGPIALEALARVHAARPEVRFRFVGRETSTLRSFLCRLAAVAPAVPVECTGFIPYDRVAGQLAGATVGMVPYEESEGVHCAFVAKIVEYLGTGLPAVSTPLRSARSYFGAEPALRFAGFDGASFGQAILDWLATPAPERQALGLAASARVARELDWSALSRRAIDFLEHTVTSTARASTAIHSAP
jgi:glycosyltransferase involved in cell wall biosynthesis